MDTPVLARPRATNDGGAPSRRGAVGRKGNKTRPRGTRCLEETSIADHIESRPAAQQDEGFAITSEREQVNSTADLGWRFAVGTALIAGGYVAWTLIPLVIATDLEPTVKAALTGLFGATPFLTKVAAVALMGRPAYNFLKRTVADFVRRRTQSSG